MNGTLFLIDQSRGNEAENIEATEQISPPLPIL